MAWLFKNKDKNAPKKIDVEANIKSIQGKLDLIKERQKVLNMRITKLGQDAVENKRMGRVHDAILAAKKRMILKKELDKKNGMEIMLTQVLFEIESSQNEQEILKIIQQSNEVLQGLRSRARLEDFEKAKEDLDEQLGLSEEISDFFKSISKEQEDECLEEIEKIEKEEEAKLKEDLKKGYSVPSSGTLIAYV
eukprot:TRINITY_DN519_c0_g1_i8.p1 TRINITY_DN519_c0_g1~~TRINITY_DN519_c0_g1_i8.p1  ORF type:complete len:221 (-),score=79.72 TRINITY_DN519_c0_g1_i8:270-848(-)